MACKALEATEAILFERIKLVSRQWFVRGTMACGAASGKTGERVGWRAERVASYCGIEESPKGA